MADLEARLAGRALAWGGGIAIVAGAVLFLSLAFSRGWIGPELRVGLGIAAGLIGIALGTTLLIRQNQLLGHVLMPVGTALITISLIAATSLYHLVPVELGLLGALIGAGIVAVIAVRVNSQVEAIFGLIAVLAAPPLMGAAPNVVTLLFVAIILVGTTGIGLWRSWPWLAPVAFILSSPQVATWLIHERDVPVGLAGLSGYWLLNVIASGGEALRRRRDDLSPSSATVLLANAAFAVWGGFTLLQGDLSEYRGAFLVLVAIGHLVVGGVAIARHGEDDLFGLLAVGTGVAALTIAAPVQFGAPIVPIAWSAEAVALGWLAARRGHPFSAIATAVLYLLAGARLVALFGSGFGTVGSSAASVAALGFFTVAVAAGIWSLRDRTLRVALTTLGLAVVSICAAEALEPEWAVRAWSGLLVVGSLTRRVLDRLPGAPIRWRTSDAITPRRIADLRASAARSQFDAGAIPAAIVIIGAVAVGQVMATDLPLNRFGDVLPPPVPFTDAGALAALVLVAGFALAAWIDGSALWRWAATLASGCLIAYAVPFEVLAWAVVVCWVALAVTASTLARSAGILEVAFRGAAASLLGLAAIVWLGIVAPPTRLAVGDTRVDWLVLVQRVASGSAVVMGFFVGSRVAPSALLARAMRIAAGILAVYLLSVAAVDVVATRVGGSVSTAELATQGQVVLSVLWAVLGVLGFVAGLRISSADLRRGGLCLLALATAKVFLFDLAALDVAYRVISLVVLGVLLLASAGIWQRFAPKPSAVGEPGSPPG
jgi:uncharacterized membrane protein